MSIGPGSALPHAETQIRVPISLRRASRNHPATLVQPRRRGKTRRGRQGKGEGERAWQGRFLLSRDGAQEAKTEVAVCCSLSQCETMARERSCPPSSLALPDGQTYGVDHGGNLFFMPQGLAPLSYGGSCYLSYPPPVPDAAAIGGLWSEDVCSQGG